ncbi:GDP-mannose mannosyl hydrolase [Hydrogenimonas sp. SS33]|uniref:GDP-mannose mannosyl hydrolase n=1 Tax=Hydrogenimonas leucolamina TaxID=2954236 RepID=UPI00336C1D41
MKRLDDTTFRCVVENAPLVSVDLIAEHDGKILLGKRKNRPAQGFYFTTGGRIFKNETIEAAQNRIAKEELGLENLPHVPEFMGVFEHFYDDSIFDGVSTHYVNLAYYLRVPKLQTLPREQHTEYRWFGIDELLASDEVHKYVKNYFTED